MADFTLTAASPLAGYDQTSGGIRLRNVTDLALVSIALPLGGGGDSAVEHAFGMALPPVGKSQMSQDGTTRLARLGRDQLMALFAHASPDAESLIAAKLNGQAYTTDQTDVWVGLEMSGGPTRTALERICPIDLHPDTFGVDQVARTVMEHLGAVIIRTGEESYLLLSASSSAGSFLHALEISIRNVI